MTRFDDKQFFNVPIVHLTGLHLLRAMCVAQNGGDLSTAIALSLIHISEPTRPY